MYPNIVADGASVEPQGTRNVWGTGPEGQPLGVDHFIQWKDVIGSLHRVVQSSGERLEGNCLCRMNKKDKEFLIEGGKKSVVRRNLFHLAQNVTSVLEVGFNAGHSAALFFYGWDMRDAAMKPSTRLRGASEEADSLYLSTSSICSYLAFDLCEHGYSKPCFEQLRQIYAPAGHHLQLVPGDSMETLKTHDGLQATYDLIHVDGGHTSAIASSDIRLCRRFAEPGKTLLLVDDAKFPCVAEAIDGLIHEGLLTEVNFAKVPGMVQTSVHRLFVYN